MQNIEQLPQAQNRDYAADIWHEENRLFKDYLEEKFDVEITDEKLRASVRTFNRLRDVTCEMYELMQLSPPPLTGSEMMMAMQKGSFKFHVEEYIEDLQSIVETMKQNVADNTQSVSSDAKRILLTGCPTGGVIQKIGMVIENNGGVIVCLDNCGGERTQKDRIDENAEDILRAISDRYLNINCSVMSPNTKRAEMTAAMVEKYRVDGVIEMVLQACHTFNVEAMIIERKMKSMNVPYTKIETDYSTPDSGQIETRIAAFIEML